MIKKSSCQKIRLGEFITVLTDYHANGSYEKLKKNVTLLDEPDYAVMIRTTNFEKDDFSGDLKYISESAYNFLSKSKVYPGDILMNKIANAGSVYLMPNLNRPVSLAMNLFLIRTNEDQLNQRFAYYYLKANEQYVKSFAIGTATTTITKENVRGLEVIKPDIEIQHKVVAILSMYESLIENNLKRIKILEEMSQMIYREWFVNFHFPEYEKVKMVKSELGMIPEGWEVKRVSQTALVHRGRSYKSSELSDEGGLSFLNLKCISRDGGFRHDGIKQYIGQYKATQTAKMGDIIMAVTDMTQERRIVARAARVPRLADEFAVVSMDLVKIEPLPNLTSEYLYGMFRFSDFPDEVKQHANGANVLHLNPEHIGAYKFVVPDYKLQQKYATFAQSVYQQCDVLQAKINNLRKTRDLLLPKLITGKIPLDGEDDE